MPQCKMCPNHNSYHLVPVVHPSTPDTVDHLCLDCFNKEVVKTGEIDSKIVKESKDALDTFFVNELYTPPVQTRNAVGDFVHPYCCSCEKTLIFCQNFSRVSISNKKPKEKSIPIDDQGNAIALVCSDCIKLGKKPRFAIYKIESTREVKFVDVNELLDN